MKYLIQLFSAYVYFNSQEGSRLKTPVKSQLEAFLGHVFNPAFPMVADLMAADGFADTIRPAVIAGINPAVGRFFTLAALR